MNPLSKSKEPYNGYTVDCEPTGRYSSYKLCLSIIEAIESGVAGDSCQDCQIALNDGACPAKSMRRTEIDAGESLYYEESPLKKIHEDRSKPPELEIVTRSPKTLSSESYQRGRGLIDQRITNSVSAARDRPVVTKRAGGKTPLIIDAHAQLLIQTSREEVTGKIETLKLQSINNFVNQKGRKESAYAKSKYK